MYFLTNVEVVKRTGYIRFFFSLYSLGDFPLITTSWTSTSPTQGRLWPSSCSTRWCFVETLTTSLTRSPEDPCVRWMPTVSWSGCRRGWLGPRRTSCWWRATIRFGPCQSMAPQSAYFRSFTLCSLNTTLRPTCVDTTTICRSAPEHFTWLFNPNFVYRIYKISFSPTVPWRVWCGLCSEWCWELLGSWHQTLEPRPQGLSEVFHRAGFDSWGLRSCRGHKEQADPDLLPG